LPKSFEYYDTLLLMKVGKYITSKVLALPLREREREITKRCSFHLVPFHILRNVHLLHQVLMRGHWNSHWKFWEKLEWCSFRLVSHFEGWMFIGVIGNCDFIFLIPISLGMFFILSVVTSHFVIEFCNFHCHYHQYHLTNVETHHSHALSYMIHIQRCIICDPYITFVTRFVTFFYHLSYVTCARWMIIFCHFLQVSSTYIYSL